MNANGEYGRLTRYILMGVMIVLGAEVLRADELPELPPIPEIPDPLAEDTVPLENSGTFDEVNLDLPISQGPYEPTWDSIEQNYPGTPDWLREAKFGIWVHFGPQAAGESGDWYARRLYSQGTTAYNNHLANYGHPSEVGYKEVLRDWNPTQLDPGALVNIYTNAGARFLIIQGVHHDQFDNWDSRYQPWNSVNLGPKRDLLGEWEQAARAAGIRFGVTFHHEYSWWWWQTAFQSDSSGALAGVPYDGNLTLADGVGKWWEGMDPRLLYGVNLREYAGVASAANSAWSPPAAGIFTNHLEYAEWYSEWWALRMMDVVDKYQPDFIYTDGTDQQPFSGYGTGTGFRSDAMQRVIADYYNKTLARRGEVDVFSIVKFRNKTNGTVNTEEGGIPGDIKKDQEWIAETPVGDWYYGPGFTYSSDAVIRYLLEEVSRDGNIGLCVSLLPDGSLDQGSSNMLCEVGNWMRTNGQGIYGSRAWEVLGEGADGRLNVLPGGKLGASQANHTFYTTDFRFTVGKDGFLYAWCMTVPEAGEELIISTLGLQSDLLGDPITSVELLGYDGGLSWNQAADGLHIVCPESMGYKTAIGFKIGPASIILPSTPSDLDAEPSDNQIRLTWNSPDVAEASCTVERSADQGLSYTIIASNLTDQVYIDPDVLSGILYSYRVCSTEAGRESATSTAVSAALSAEPSASWYALDIGEVASEGSFSESDGVLSIGGSGSDIWYSSDEFRYVFQSVQGDCMLTARVLNMDNTASWAKAGVMMRETLSGSSKYVIHYLSPNNGVALQQRSSSGGSASGVAGSGGVSAPYWIRLMREGDVFNAYSSPDGANWALLGSTAVSMSDAFYVGLAVCSVKDGTLNQATFDHVSFTNEVITVPVNSTIIWSDPQTVTNNLNILHSGTLIHAGNFRSDSQSVSVKVDTETVLFENRPSRNALGELLAGEEARIIQGAGGRQVNSGLFNAAGTDVDSYFELVLDGSAWENSDPGPAPGATDMILRVSGVDGEPLVKGRRYQIQLIYCDARNPARSQVYHDGTTGYITSAAVLAGQSTAVVGTFIAGDQGYQDVYIQNASGGANYPVALNAYVLQQVSGPDTEPTDIEYAVSGEKMELFWPVSHTGWCLESNSVGLMAPNEWHEVMGSVETNQFRVDINGSATNVFFRLVYP